jgi:enoyl-CoA hydratase/carnithine racemase
MLDKLEGTMAETYATRSGGDLKAVRQMMADETWLTADDAIAAGFANSKLEDAAAAPNRARAFIRNFDRVPEALRARLDLKPMSALTQGQTLPARVGGAEAAPPETPMNAETFSKYAAENPDAAEVKSLSPRGTRPAPPTPVPMRRSA